MSKTTQSDAAQMSKGWRSSADRHHRGRGGKGSAVRVPFDSKLSGRLLSRSARTG